MNSAVRVCELCGSSDDVALRWIAEHDDESGELTGWTETLLCASCAAGQEQPPEFIALNTDELAGPRPRLPDPPVQLGFKSLMLENWRRPDPVSAAYVGRSPLDGQFHTLTGDDWAYHILAIPLAETVPAELRRLFEVARGTMLYGWFFYPAFTLASEQILRVADAAVARRCRDLGAPASVRTFQKRLRWLGQRGDLSAENLHRWDAVRHLRNLASHPGDQDVLLPGMVISQVRLLAEAIGSLFAAAASVEMEERPGA